MGKLGHQGAQVFHACIVEGTPTRFAMRQFENHPGLLLGQKRTSPDNRPMADVTNSRNPNSSTSRAPAPRVTPPPKFPPRKPRLALPAGSVDSHLHMFGPADSYPFAVDAQYISGDATDEMYFRAQDILGLSKAVLVSGGAYGQTFDHLIDMLQRHPQRLRPSPPRARTSRSCMRPGCGRRGSSVRAGSGR
jgi:hypothetical protein